MLHTLHVKHPTSGDGVADDPDPAVPGVAGAVPVDPDVVDAVPVAAVPVAAVLDDPGVADAAPAGVPAPVAKNWKIFLPV